MKFMNLVLIFLFMPTVSFASDAPTLTSSELETLLNGKTRVGSYSRGTYYLTFREDKTYCLRLNTREGDCFETGAWRFESNTVCRNSPRRGEYCWTVEKTGDAQYTSEIVRVISGTHYKVGGRNNFTVAD